MPTKKIALAFLVLVLLLVAATGAGWKWGSKRQSAVSHYSIA